METTIDVPGLVASYKRLVLWFGVQLLCGLLILVAVFLPPDSPIVFVLVWARLLGTLVTIVAMAIYAYRVATALGSRAGIVWALAMVVPCVNVITLLALSSNATRACRAAGIPVGLLGPKLS